MRLPRPSHPPRPSSRSTSYPDPFATATSVATTQAWRPGNDDAPFGIYEDEKEDDEGTAVVAIREEGAGEVEAREEGGMVRKRKREEEREEEIEENVPDGDGDSGVAA